MTTQARSLLGVALVCAGCTSSTGQTLVSSDSPDAGEAASQEPRGDASSEPDADITTEFTLDHVQMRGTHNSYHLAPVIALDNTHRYSHVPLEEQLANQGVRVFELDLHRANADDSIDVYHIATIDARTTCLNFEDCLRTLRGWSEAHPKHVPIIVWVEIKDSTGGGTFDNLDAVDAVLRSELGERLVTPDDVQGDAATLRASITEGWPRLDSVRGKFLFIVLSEDADIDKYTEGYTTLRGRAMFVRVGVSQFQTAVAAFCKLDVNDTANIQAAHAANLMIATNVCTIEKSDEECEQNRQLAVENGIHMLKDDLPAPIPGRSYFMALPEGKPVACNPVRAPTDCTAEALESL